MQIKEKDNKLQELKQNVNKLHQHCSKMAAEMGQLRTEEKASQQKVASLEETVAAQQAELDEHAELAAAIHTMTDKKK